MSTVDPTRRSDSREDLPVWALLGPKAGDNEQVIALAEALERPYRIVRLRYTGAYRLPNRLLGATLHSLAAADPDLTPPWPKLVLAAGRRSVPVARWIQRVAGHRVRLVQIGRPRAPLGWFDLVLAPPQYHLPARRNLVRLPLPLVRAQRADDPHPAWTARIADLPAPRAAVLIGGDARARDLTRATVWKTLDAAAERVGHGGSLMVTTSPRTEEGRLPDLQTSCATLVYRWHAQSGRDNPMDAFLDKADRIVVTGDSVSMLARAVATGKPVTVVPVPRRAPYSSRAGAGLDLLRLWQRGLANAPLLTPPPDPDAVFEALVADGRAAWTEGLLDLPGRPGVNSALIAPVCARILSLIDGNGAGGA
ncbi:mitochondrial fission ELM1 family protein [Rhodovibrio salinarum]|uniref:mitochondrial fission ELM1 family protein n=1 Tax=Rhodovibrio salinarum TaxID=1087 RepID=UPI0004B883E1|nr:ELM1/GtrOC1 family putative glycosyltransferase [Rhodovibrio salinarum]